MNLNCNNLNPINVCQTSLSGIKRIWLIPFGDIWGYEYDSLDNHTSFVTDYNLNIIPVEYQSNQQSNFNESLVINELDNSYSHSLSVSIPEMSNDKRTEFEKLINKELSIVFKDNNDRCWIIGQQYPVKLTSFSSTSGQSASFNGYNLEFTGKAKHQIREISCFDLPCLVSVSGREIYQSSFLIESASGYDYSGLMEVIADTTISGTTISNLNQWTPAIPLDPTNWTNPIIYNRDLATITQLFNPSGSPDIIIGTLIYDNTFDRLIIDVYSLNTSFDYLVFNGQLALRSDRNIALNLQILSGTLLNGATFTVKDGTMTTLYTGIPTTNIFGQNVGLSGIVSDAYINLSLLYPNGTTFTITTSGALGTCSTATYTYNVGSTANCNLNVLGKVYTGRHYDIVIDKYDDPFYRDTRFFLNGQVLALYPNASDWHSDFNVLSVDVQTLFSNYSTILPIDLTTLSITEQPKTWTISFLLNNFWDFNERFDSHATTYSDSASTLDNLDNEKNIQSFFANRSTVLNIETITASDSLINIDDALAIPNNLSGLYNNLPTNNNLFLLETITGEVSDKTNDIGFDCNQYEEIDEFTISVDSTACPNQSDNLLVTTCFEGINKATTAIYYRMYSDISGNATTSIGSNFELDNDGTIYSFTTPTPVTRNPDSISEFVNLLNDVPSVKVLNFQYIENQQRYELELLMLSPSNDVLNGITIVDLGITFAMEEFLNEVSYNIYPKLHPAITVEWSFPTFDLSLPLYNETKKVKEPLYLNRIVENPVLDYLYDSITGDITFYISGLTQNNALNGGYYIAIYTGFPYGLGFVLIYLLPSGVSLQSYPFITNLVGVGLTPADITYFRIKSVNGDLDIVQKFDSVTDDGVLTSITDRYFRKSAYGYFDNFSVLYPTNLVHSATYTVTSVNCPAFSPEQISGLRLWTDTSRTPETDLVWDIQGGLFVVGGSNIISGVSIGEAQIGMLLRIDGFTNTYTITNIIGGDIILSSIVVETPGVYNIRLAKLSKWKDYSPANRLLVDSLANLPYYRVGQVNGLATAYFYPNSKFDINPIIDSAPASWYVFAVTKQSDLSTNGVLISHQELASEPFIQMGFQEYNGKVTQVVFDDLGNGTSVLSSSANDFQFGIYNWVYSNPDYNDPLNPNSLRIEAGTNTDINDNATGSVNNPVLSSVETIGAYFTGISYVDGFAGDIAEILIYSNINNAQYLQVLDYLRGKYNI